MRAKKSGNDIERLLSVQFAQKPQRLQFRRGVEPVAAFCLDGRCAVRRETHEVASGALLQLAVRRGAERAHARQNAAARARDLLVGLAFDARRIIFHAAARENQMRV